jgi:ABC-2 type transport system ATP-binding protein
MLGAPLGHRPTLGRIGYLPEHANFPGHLTGRQVVEFTAGLAKMPRRGRAGRITEVLDRVGMLEAADRRCGSYSKGMRQRIGLAQALVHDPALVFLDEPTDGVDPAGRVEIRRMIEEMREQGRTVFINSHLLAEVEQVVDAVAIMARGEIVLSGALEELTQEGLRFELRTLGPVPLEARSELEAEGLKVAGDRVEIVAADAAGIQPWIDWMRTRRIPIREIREQRSTLEEVFLRVTEEPASRVKP